MKHGIILPAEEGLGASSESLWTKIGAFLRAWRNFALIVLLPTIAFAGYQYLVAADRYESTSDFLVKSGDSSGSSSGGFGDMLGITVRSQSQVEIMSVPDYLESHEVLDALQKQIDLVALFRRPEADFFSRLRYPAPEPERLLKYYRSRVQVKHDSDTGMMHLSVQAFRPEDSYKLAQLLLQLGERKINDMNVRSYRDAVDSARSQLRRAEDEAASVQRKITGFRQVSQDIDPALSGQAQIKLISDINGRLASARAQLNAMLGVIRSDSPQVEALRRQIRSMERELVSQEGKMGASGGPMSMNLGEYEELKVRQDFAAKNYAAAAANLQRAIEQARKQQLYFVHVVDPNLPVRSLYPKRETLVLTLFFSLAVAYAIGWLVVAGVREHEA
ncbi:lipopolysaccharide biosynthesis protein [Sphingomonas sp. R1]|uniref:lipopolysaccharide biosynthesis protein n=1 Tax=Sphingomonas sp. R1 TaxID=399176 RepID=UPI0022243675|nr:lipopolysaccharide biosynthesis protein [Sphingomonas sp. R1]UYY76418.1 lipopolysaccharide biosynthesis protein [Sphingomonas sp. R1]